MIDAADRPLLVGQAPHRSASEGFRPLLEGRSGAKLAEVCGLDAETYGAVFETANLLGRWPGKQGKGDAFPMPEARAAAMEILGKHPTGTIICVGKRVASAFGLRRLGYFEWARHGGVWLSVIPHPSGINRWWNLESNGEKARKFMRELVEDVIGREINIGGEHCGRAKVRTDASPREAAQGSGRGDRRDKGGARAAGRRRGGGR